MDAYMYQQGYVKGLSPFEYRGKNPDFYKQRHRENMKVVGHTTSVEPGYKYLVPSKWRKTGWRYSELPEVKRYSPSEKSEFLSTYTQFFSPPQIGRVKKAKKPVNFFSRPESLYASLQL